MCRWAALAAVVVLVLVVLVARSVGILDVVVETFVVTFVGLVLVRTALCVVSSVGRWFRSLGKSVWTRTRCLCLFLRLCCLGRFLASGLLGRRRRVTMGS